MLKRILMTEIQRKTLFIAGFIGAITLIIILENHFGDGYLLSLLFNASDPALIIAILGILLATQVAAFGVLLLVITIFISTLILIRPRQEGGSITYRINNILNLLIIGVLLPSIAKTTIPSLLLLLLALYLQQAPPIIMWLLILGVLVAVSIHEILQSTHSTYHIIMSYDSCLEIAAGLRQFKNRSDYPKKYNCYIITKENLPRLHKKVNIRFRIGRLLTTNKRYFEDEWNLKLKEEIKDNLTYLKEIADSESLLDILNSKKSKKWTRLVRARTQATDGIVMICLNLMYQDLENDKLIEMLDYGFDLNTETLESCLILLHTHIKYVNKVSGNPLTRNINSDEKHLYTLYGYVLSHLSRRESEAGFNEIAAQYHSAACDAYKWVENSNPKKKVY